MSGWDKTEGKLEEDGLPYDEYWALFNFVFSDASMKRNTYKFGFIKSVLDNLFNAVETKNGMALSYIDIFSKFAENYWNLIVKYNLKQMRRDSKSEYSRIEQIFREAVDENPILRELDFSSIDEESRNQIINKVNHSCRRNVIGALFEDFDGKVYSYNLKESELIIGFGAYEFMLRHKFEIEKLNYYAWAKFLEKVNVDNVLVRVIDKLELATPHREDLSIYREILRKEFEEDNCFYCGRKLDKGIHVDHFIPWSFVKDDKIWNFVLACPQCNLKKNDSIPKIDYLVKLSSRNQLRRKVEDNGIVRKDFSRYSEDLLKKMWTYAKASGLKEFSNVTSK